MAGTITETRTLSDLLGGLELCGHSWCYSDIAVRAGFSVPPGDAVLFHAVLHGTMRLTSASSGTITLAAGDAIMMLSGEAHALRSATDCSVSSHDFLRHEREVDVPPSIAIGSDGPTMARVLSGRMRPIWPGEINRSALPTRLHVAGEASSASPLLRPEALALAGIGAGSAALLTRLASLMLIAGLRADPHCRQMFSPAIHDPITQAMSLIAANPAANWSVERLARSVGMGRSNFAAHFTAKLARAPMDVVAQARMELAAKLLTQGRLKIAEISEMAGYCSEAAFSRRFTRHFGVSPSQMRISIAAQESTPAAPSWQPLLAGKLAKGAAALVRQRPALSRAKAPSGKPRGASMLIRGTLD